MTAFTSMSRVWPGATVVCAGSGPSLTASDLEACRGRARVIVVNDAYRLAPWADCLYAADDKWWKWNQGAPDFAGLKVTVEPCRKDWPGLKVMKNTGRWGIESASNGLRTGFNSGYQAINLAVHLGASRILLLGYDMHGDHFFGSHPDGTRPPFASCLGAFQTLVAPLQSAGVEIYNCTTRTALHAFPQATLAEMLPMALEVAS
jgi:hypothetical protein